MHDDATDHTHGLDLDEERERLDEQLDDVTRLKFEDGTLTLAYNDGASHWKSFAETVAAVAGVCADLVAAEPAVARVEATACDGAGDERATFHIEREWAEAFNADEIEGREYATKVLMTVPLWVPGCSSP